MVAASGIHQLSGDPQLVGRPSHAALQQVRHSQLAAYVLRLCCFVLVREGGSTRDDEQARNSGESGNEVIGDAVAEILLLAVTTHVGEGQDGNRGLIGQCESWRLHRWNRRGG